MTRLLKINQSLLLLLAISIPGYHSAAIDNSYKETLITAQNDLKTVDDTLKTTDFPITTLPYEISSGSQTTIDAILSEETIVYNRFATPPSQYEEYTTVYEDPAEDHVTAYSEHEEPKDVPTRPNYTGPGVWAKPAKDKDIPLEFVPTKLYAQVRGTHTVKRVPQEEASKSAQSEEEKESAPRLREVVKNSKVNTIYTEEGYEDAAYDHAGHIRDADFHEGYARKLHDQTDVKKKAKVAEGDKQRNRSYKKLKEFDDYNDDYSDHYEKTTPRVELKKLSQAQRVTQEINPKLVTENGIEELQRDLRREELATERDSELNKLRDTPKDEALYEGNDENFEKSVEENATQRRTRKRQKAKIAIDKEEPKSIEEEKTNEGTGVNNEYYEVSPYTDRSVLDVPTTVNYGQIFFDFLKSKNGQSTTEVPLTTLNSISQTPLTVGIVSDKELYSHSSDKQLLTTPVESRISRLKDVLSEPISSNVYTENVKNLAAEPTLGYAVFPSNLVRQDEPWRPLNPSEVLGSSYILNDKSAVSPASISEAVNGTEESIKELAENNPFDALHDSLTDLNFRPRYKVLVRPKPKKTNKNRLTGQESSDSRPIKEEPLSNLNSKHRKVLNYLRNENYRNSVDLPHHVNGYNHKYGGEFEDLRKFRSPYKQEVHSLPFGQSSITLESESLGETNWQKQHGEQYPGLNSFARQAQIYQDPFTMIRPAILTQASFPSTKLVPPAPLTSNDYVTYQPRNFMPKFRSVAYDGTRLVGRKKRSTDEFHPDNVKVVDETKNSTANRSVIERRSYKNVSATRRPRMKRNSRRKVSALLMGNEIVLDTLNALDIEKKLRVHMNRNERKNASVKLLPKQSDRLIIDRESTVTSARKNDRKRDSIEEIVKSQLDNAHSLEDNLKYRKNVPIYEEIVLTIAKRDVNGADSSNNLTYKKEINKGREESLGTITKRDLTSQHQRRRKTQEELLNESPRIANEVIEKEIDSRFNEKDKSEGEERGKVEVEVPDFDYVEELVEEDHIETTTTTEAPLDLKKYPFYNNERIASPALKYAVDPQRMPRKTAGGMEFYESRDTYKECSEVDPNLDEVLPKEEEPDEDKDLKEDLPRLRGLGDQLDCFKAKYFDEMPFDNPLFSEKEVEEPTLPKELDPRSFASRIMILPEENDEYVVQTLSKKPEREYKSPRNPNFAETIRVSGIQTPNHFDKHKERERNSYRKRLRTTNKPNERKAKQREPFTIVEAPRFYPARLQTPKRRPVALNTEKPRVNPMKIQESRKLPFSPAREESKLYHSNVQFKRRPSKRPQPKVEKAKKPSASLSELYSMTPYESEVYEDVMGNIRHMVNTYKVHEDAIPSEKVPATVASNVEIKGTNSPMNYYTEDETGDLIDVSKSNNFIPPQYRESNHRKRNRFPLKTDSQKRLVSPRVVGRYQTIRIHKRSADNDKVSSKSSENSMKELVLKESNDSFIRSQANVSDLVADESVPSSSNKDVSAPFKRERSKRKSTGRTNSEIDSSKKDVSFKGERSKRKITGRNNSEIDSSSKENAEDNKRSVKATYTIKDRIRYSKPKEEIMKVGKFSENGTLVDEDHRRKEPRYNHARRRKAPIEQSPPSTSAPSHILTNKKPLPSRGDNKPEKFRKLESKERSDNKKSNEHSKEQGYNFSGEILKITPKSSSENNSKKEVIKHSNKSSSETSTERPSVKAYAVYEKLEDDIPMTTMRPVHSGHSSTLTKPRNFPSYSSQKKYDSSKEYKSGEADKSEVNNKSESGSSEDDLSKGNKSSEEDKAFVWYNSRPSSPAENYEDDKYSDLGPRISKPDFYHPPFVIPSYKHRKDESMESNSESESEKMSDESDEDETFPWFRHSDETGKYRNRYGTGRYEFPWEQRDHLIKKHKRNKQQAYRNFRSDEDDEDSNDSVPERKEHSHKRNNEKYRDENYSDDSESSGKDRVNKGNKGNRKEKSKSLDEDSEDSDGHSEYIYPWDRARLRSRKNRRDTSKDTDSDQESGSSEIRPVMKYSSRYKSKEFSLPLVDKPLTAAANSVQEISESVNKAIEATINQSSSSQTTENPFDKKSRISTTENIRGISRGALVPEDVTLAPNRKAERKKLAKLTSSSAEISTERNGPIRIASDVESKRSKSKKHNTDIGSKEEGLKSTESTSNVIKTVNTTESSRRRRRPLKTSPSNINTIKTTSADTVSGVNRRSHRRQKQTTVASTVTPSSIPTTPKSVRRQTAIQENIPKGNTTKRTSKTKSRKEEDQLTTTQPSNKKPTAELRSRSTRKKIASSTVSPDKEVKEKVEENSTSKPTSTRVRTTTIKPAKEEKSTSESVVKKVLDKKVDKLTIMKEEEVTSSSSEKSVFNEQSSTVATVESDNEKIVQANPLDSLAVEDKSKDENNKQRDDSYRSLMKSEVSFSPTNGAVKLSEHSSREIISSVSWISEKYTF